MLLCYPLMCTEKHVGLCVCGGRPSDMAHYEFASESQTLLHPENTGAHQNQLHTKWIWSFCLLQHTRASWWKGNSQDHYKTDVFFENIAYFICLLNASLYFR